MTARRSQGYHYAKWGLIFVLPGLLSYILFSLYPLLSSIVQSFHYIRGAGNPWRFVWFSNYVEILGSKDFWESLKVTLIYVLLTVPLGVFLSFVVAIAITAVGNFRGFIRALYFIPSVAGVVVIGIVFSWMYEPYNGLYNMVLEKFGFGPFLWLRGQGSALASIAAMTIWRTLGYNVVILMAGILSIPGTFYDAAAMDGVGILRKHISITIPLTLPTIIFVVVYNTIHNMQMFAEAFVMTGGGPALATTTIGYRIYREAFLFSSFGRAVANSVVLMMIIVCITILQMKILKQQDYSVE